ncbi:hypothetical protein GTW40_02505 [Streptomyces sp. SID4985]|uniref:hypothetical protein n=1 Tax=Streptomyces sp. SID4985 TaxID=2690292 RepID=UPI00136E8E3E|nr:hypothetical protein [Streptomyces sp. SID4985]MYQ43946.1 hypothetical protein [Streptomyces sp. SID4985]
MCSAIVGDAAAAALSVTQTITDLPPEHRSALITYRARQVARRVPETSELRVLRKVLALPAGERGDKGADQRGD